MLNTKSTVKHVNLIEIMFFSLRGAGVSLLERFRLLLQPPWLRAAPQHGFRCYVCD